MPVVTNHQYEAPILPTSWTGDEKKFYTRLIDVLDEIYSKYGRLSLKDLSPAVRKQLSELVDNTTFQTFIEQTEREILLKADASTVYALGQTVSSHSTLIQQNAEAITAKASQSSVDSLTGRVTQAETSLTLKADQATLTSTANGLQSQIDAVPGKITLAVNNVQVGGRNLLLKSGTQKQTSSYLAATYAITEAPAIGDEVRIRIWGTLGPDRTAFSAYNSEGYVPIGGFVDQGDGTYLAQAKWRNVYNGHTANDTTLWIFQMPNTGTSTSQISKIKLEKGTKATEWTPAPEDTDAAINDLNTQLSLVPGQITAAISNVNIGGRNYVKNSETMTREAYTSGWTHMVVCEGLPAGKSMMLSIDSIIQNSGTTPDYLDVTIYNGSSNPSIGHLQVSASRQSIAFTVPSDGTTYNLLIYCGVQGSANNKSFTFNHVMLEEGNKATAWSPSPEDPASGVVNNSITIDTEGIKMSSSDVFQLVAANSSKNSYIDIHGLLTADNNGGLTAASGSFANTLSVGGQRVLTLADVGIPIKVSTSQPSGHGFVWLQPSSVTSVRYTGYTADSRNSTVMFSTSQRTITRSFAAEASNTLVNGTFTYTLTFEVMSLSDAQLTGVTFSATATKGSTVSFSASSAITLTKYQTATITLTATSSTNLASNANAISVAITATASSYGGLYLNSKQWMTLTIAKSGGSGTQGCNVYYIP